MTDVPEHPKIYHITHVDNLAKIAESGELLSDAKRIEFDLACQVVGMSDIKQRRLEELSVKCHPGTKVGEYVPFYFCPRSVMLFILFRGNHPDLTYDGGQRPIVHLEADLRNVVAWANAHQRKWAFSDCNAGARYARFWASLGDLANIAWDAIEDSDFSDPVVKEGKQAECLIYGTFPWELVESIGVHNAEIATQIKKTLVDTEHTPTVNVKKEWYY